MWNYFLFNTFPKENKKWQNVSCYSFVYLACLCWFSTSALLCGTDVMQKLSLPSLQGKLLPRSKNTKLTWLLSFLNPQDFQMIFFTQLNTLPWKVQKLEEIHTASGKRTWSLKYFLPVLHFRVCWCPLASTNIRRCSGKLLLYIFTFVSQQT